MEEAPLASAHEALRLAEAQPAEAAARALTVVRRAARAGDRTAQAVAERAWGLALRHRGDVDRALVHLRRAVALALEAGAAEVAGEARVTLAFALVERGRSAQALEEVDRAGRERSAPARGRGRSQRGAVLLEMGRHPPAPARGGRGAAGGDAPPGDGRARGGPGGVGGGVARPAAGGCLAVDLPGGLDPRAGPGLPVRVRRRRGGPAPRGGARRPPRPAAVCGLR